MSSREDYHAHFLRVLAVAADACTEWCDVVRQDREKYAGSTHADTLVDDPEYGAALTVFAAVSDSLDLARRVGA